MKIFLTVFIVLLSFINFSSNVDTAALTLHESTFDRSLAAFAIAKALNAVISLFQGTQLSFTPIGMGVNISIGEILDPLNDLIERFSWIMLAATISLGIQKFFLLIGTKLFIQIAFFVSSVFFIMLLWMKNIKNRTLLNISIRLFIVIFIFRFATIIFIYLNQFIYSSLLENDYNSASVTLTSTNQQINKEFNVEATTAHGLKEMFDVQHKLETLRSLIDNASRQIITLSTVFVLSSIMLPLLYIWIFIFSIRFAITGKIETENILQQIKRES
ncbi:hypothetical protein KKA17_02235 [bacterium]|nr:hypothetical protein [bacterium]MBU1884815.1 hypothetical protein [bacterium]